MNKRDNRDVPHKKKKHLHRLCQTQVQLFAVTTQYGVTVRQFHKSTCHQELLWLLFHTAATYFHRCIDAV